MKCAFAPQRLQAIGAMSGRWRDFGKARSREFGFEH
jgi:hypothetical protein